LGNVTIYIHKSIHDAVDAIAVALDTSRSETIEDMIRYILDNELEEEVWGDRYTEGLEALEAFVEGSEEEEEEEGEDEEEEEEEGEEES